ncbi:SWIB/MDM2 domain protein [Penicillium brasilianum]|uniref:SWIB/MDM2 domain protein n=1 Tax=Penicillium brasilianum TaxID=104259 RepID=A0A1S9S1B7_PENBI|nr:SWIB/MDM2 domain protein [Penicillium brasilianum]
MERFDIFASNKGVHSPEETSSNGHTNVTTAVAVPSPPPSSSPVKRQAHSEEASEPASASPPPKKRKPDADVDADALFAAKLQAEENMRARPTRGANTRRAAPSKKKSKAKTSKRVKAEDDSDVDSGSDTKKEVNRTGGFHKPLNLSAPLSALLGGETTLSRPQTVKKVWQYIRENELQDPSDRRQIRCDDAMRAVFKQDRVHMFTMTKILNQNLYNPDE